MKVTQKIYFDEYILSSGNITLRISHLVLYLEISNSQGGEFIGYMCG